MNIEKLQIVMETITAAENRRQVATSTHVAIVAGIAVFASASSNLSHGFLSLVSMLVSISWLLNINGYAKLLKAKWTVAEKIQKDIQFEPFLEERDIWTRNSVRGSLTISNTEKIIPTAILLISITIAINSLHPFSYLQSFLTP